MGPFSEDNSVQVGNKDFQGLLKISGSLNVMS